MNNQISGACVGKEMAGGLLLELRPGPLVAVVSGKRISLPGSSWPTAVDADCIVYFQTE